MDRIAHFCFIFALCIFHFSSLQDSMVQWSNRNHRLYMKINDVRERNYYRTKFADPHIGSSFHAAATMAKSKPSMRGLEHKLINFWKFSRTPLENPTNNHMYTVSASFVCACVSLFGSTIRRGFVGRVYLNDGIATDGQFSFFPLLCRTYVGNRFSSQ